MVSISVLGGTHILPPYCAKEIAKISQIKGISLFLLHFFNIFPQNPNIKFPHISSMEIVITFEAHAALFESLLKMVIFRLF